MSEREGSGVDRLGRSALHYAAASGDLAAVRAAIDAGADVCAGDSAGWTPLHFAAQAQRDDIAIDGCGRRRPCALVARRNCPEPLRDEVKLVAWTMINGQRRPTYLQARGVQARGRTSAPHMRASCWEWMRLARWLHKRHITSLGACTEAEWRAYAGERLGQVSRDSAAILCTRLTDLWAFDQLSARPSGISRPPWETEGVDDFLPAAATTGHGENATEPLDPLVLGPLLTWAIRVVDDFADDILAAWTERCRLANQAATNTATPDTLAALERWLLPLAQAGGPLPARPVGNTFRVARSYVAALTGASVPQTARFIQRHDLHPVAAKRPGPRPLDVPVTGRINGRPWRAHLDFNEAEELMRHLSTAAAIICLYLTGMRPQEVQGLPPAAAPSQNPPPTASQDAT